MKDRLLKAEETMLLKDCMEKLSAYHNTVTVHPDFEFRPTFVERVLTKMSAEITEGTAKAMVWEDEGRVVGFASVNLDAEKRIGRLGWLFLEEAYRGNGYGGKLLDWVMAEFRGIKATQMDINCVIGNPTEKLYRKYGFSPRIVTLTKCETYEEN